MMQYEEGARNDQKAHDEENDMTHVDNNASFKMANVKCSETKGRMVVELIKSLVDEE